MVFNARKVVLVLAGLGIGGTAQASHYYDSGYNGNYGTGARQTVSCESRNQRTVYCNADTRNGVRIYRQLSSGACIEGSTWGWDGNGIWVSGGCRAEFVSYSDYGSGYGNQGYADSGYYGGNGYGSSTYGNSTYGNSTYGNSYGGNRTIRCESTRSRTTYCRVDSQADIRLIRRLSQAYCTEGRTWGHDRQGLWVSNGCRAEFQVRSYGNRNGGGYDNGYGNSYGSGYDNGYGNSYGSGYENTYENGGGYGNGYSQRITCESRDGRYNFCRANDNIRQAQLYRQLSSGTCQYNYSWGFRGDGIWVDRGCRAEFQIY